MTYGRQSSPINLFGGNQMSITNHAIQLMEAVYRRRRARCRGRQLIFAAHSLGGILVKGAMLRPVPSSGTDCKAVRQRVA
ncbi:hypothetical protein QBC38DRAFT_491233 [Podospora fimiseda]|uniref:DUF676 domain-containing protein n=1 Tax=Podospora fimiseda TaxID=252190 RepID=A0AAN6YQ32_9PEZI|nr:hypothetical protein QBC38DRAFT_491233 [Podospora fimiseda]